MTLTKERIIDVLKQIVPDKDAEEIIFYLQDKENISEFIIAEELDLEIHRTRNLLYRLLDSNVVSFKRKKDKIKGWYICYWDFNEQAIFYLEEKLRLETIAKLKERLAKEQQGFFYMCRHAHARLGFEEAVENDFKCPECGELMNQQNNERTISFLQERIAKLEKEQAVFEKEKTAFLKIATKKAEQEIKEAQEAVEKKMDKKSTARAIKQSTKSVAEKDALTKAARKSARKATAKKTTKKKTTNKKSVVKKKKTTTKKTTSKKTTSKKTNASKHSKKTVPAKKAVVKKAPRNKKATVKKDTAEKKKTTSKTTSLKKAQKKKSEVKKLPVKKKVSVKKKTAAKKTIPVKKKASVKKPATSKATLKKPVQKKKKGLISKFAKRIGGKK